MAKIRHIEKKQKADQQTALLALAADRAGSAGECLTSEEMSGLVEENYDQNRHQELFGHLSRCEECYEEWLVLRSQHLKELALEKKQKGGKPLPFFSHPRNLAIFGSALAAVASVVLVVNIQQSKQPIVYHEDQAVLQTDQKEIGDIKKGLKTAHEAEEKERVSRQQTLRQQKPEPISEQTASRTTEKKTAAPETALVPSRQKADSLDADKSVVKKRPRVQPDLQPQERPLGEGVAMVGKIREERRVSSEQVSPDKQEILKPGAPQQKTATSARQAVKQLEPDTVVLRNADMGFGSEDWLKQVEEGCSINRYNKGFWDQLVVSAERIVKKRQGDDITDERFGKVFDRVKEMKEQKFQKLCAEIREIISKK